VKTTKKHLLVVEDDVGIQNQLKWCFEGFDVAIASDRSEAITQLRRIQPGVVLLDLGLPPDPGGVREGVSTLEEILSLSPETKVIVVTGNDDRVNAVKCVGIGAYDFYQKPIDPELLQLSVTRAHRLFELEKEHRILQKGQIFSPLSGIVAASPEMLKVCRMVEKIAPSNVTALLLGDSGTGKELFARALHELSPRAEGKLVAINCAAIPENLLESELFGYEKGAFTGAAKQTRGKIEYADEGTLFLDEIGDLPLGLQAKLLRFLQERTFERVGGRTEIRVDVRIICATHQDLKGVIKKGGFREDLFYRISEIEIVIPPLREREGDVLVLAKALLNRFNKEFGSTVNTFSKDAVRAMESYDWPGNVREMENRVKRAVIMAEGSQVSAEDLELPVPDSVDFPFNLKEVREEAERKAIRKALTFAEGNVSQTAKALGVTRPTLYSLMGKYKISAVGDG
jgi:two-component system NtrC family response regulator